MWCVVLPVSVFASIEIIINKTINDVYSNGKQFCNPCLMTAVMFTGKALYARMVRDDLTSDTNFDCDDASTKSHQPDSGEPRFKEAIVTAL